MPDQLALFAADPSLPDGFKYQPEVITRDNESLLIHEIKKLPLKEFQFQGYTGKRRTKSFGWHYDFEKHVIRKADDIPDYLLDLREIAARFAGLEADKLQHALVIEYDVGAPIGWHRD